MYVRMYVRMCVRACVCVCMCVCTCTSTYVHSRAYMWYERRCKRKRNKATLSWLRLVCCRHEVPVTSEPITVIHMDEDVVVVNKPASIPVSGVLPELYCQNKNCLSYCPERKIHIRVTHTYSLLHVPVDSFPSRSPNCLTLETRLFQPRLT